MKGKKGKLIRNLCVLVLGLLLVVAGIGCIYTDRLLGKINYIADPGNEESEDSEDPLFPQDGDSEPAKAEPDLKGGLYHDDAITNVLLLGVDNYQKNDSGRSDSMMLVSVDTRHQKLKVTSFMRDMYVAIPGIGSNKLNAAYSLGGGMVDGSKKVVSTLEANFGVDINRFVIIDFDAFIKIIDRLGGVPVTLTAKKDGYGRTEADLINLYSSSEKRARTGLNNLDGKQARYYSRIRDIGDDQERTLRQRKVFEGLVGKMKKSSLQNIYGALSDTLNLVTTNMTKEEVLSMASNSLTYLNYPVAQNRVPAEGEYKPGRISNHNIGSVLVPDLELCRKSLAEFIFEGDLPGNPGG